LHIPSTAFLACIAITFPCNETCIAYPSATDGAKVILHVRFKVGLLKGGAVFFGPQQRPGFLMFYGHATSIKWYVRASPFLAADVAEKAERKAFFVRMVC
jgi:hypothetical protein